MPSTSLAACCSWNNETRDKQSFKGDELLNSLRQEMRAVRDHNLTAANRESILNRLSRLINFLESHTGAVAGQIIPANIE